MDRRTVLGLVGLAALATQVSGCAAPVQGMVTSDVGRAPKGDDVRSTLGPFAAKVLDAMPAGNVVLSPASIAVSLAMVGNGAAATTRTQFESVLGSSFDALNVELNTLQQRLVALDGQQKTDMTFVNALWMQQGVEWQKTYLETLKRWYGAGAIATDFRGDPGSAVTAINHWCSSATKGLIPSIVDESMINELTRVVAGNAVHIKATWKQPFIPSRTSKESFRTGSGTDVSVDMMHGSVSVPCLLSGRVLSVALPFVHPDLAFVVALPADSGKLTLSELPDLTAVLDVPPGPLDLSLPKFHAEFGQALKPALTSLGLVDAWNVGTADFSGITGDHSLNLGFVQHKAVITVDENGAEGAAVTVSGVTDSALPPSFRVDRPFFWAIIHVPTRALVMLGREDDPTR